MSKILALLLDNNGTLLESCNCVPERLSFCVLRVADFSNYSKEARQQELELWRSGLGKTYPQARFVLCNPDGSGVEEL